MTTTPPPPPAEHDPDTRASVGPSAGRTVPVVVVVDGAAAAAAPTAAPDPAAPTRTAWSPRRRKIAAGAALAVLAVGGVAGAVGYHLYQNPLGAQPYDVLPAGAVAYAGLDLDPSLQQKVAYVRIQKLLPETDGKQTDLFQDVLTQLLDADSYAQIEDFVGKRVGAGVYAPERSGAEPGLVVAVQVTDQAKAETYLRTKGDDVAYGFRDGFALIAEESRTAPATTGATLASDDAFGDAMDEIGDDNVARYWVDLGAASAVGRAAAAAAADELAGDTVGPLDTSDDVALAGTLAGELTVLDSPAALQLTAVGHGVTVDGRAPVTSSAAPVADQLRAAPADAYVVGSFSGLDEAVKKSWGTIAPELEAADADPGSFLDAYGLRLPDDATKLLGTSTTVAVGPARDGTAMSSVYLAAQGADRATLADIVDDIVQEIGQSGELDDDADLPDEDGTGPGLPAVTVEDRDGAVVATVGRFPEGRLGDDTLALSSLVDLDDAQVALVADLDALDSRATPAAPRGVVGLTSTSKSGGESSSVLRWVLPG